MELVLLTSQKGGGSYETAGWVCNITSVTEQEVRYKTQKS